MNLFKSLAGAYEIKIVSASPENILLLLNNAGIAIWNINFDDALTVRCAVKRNQFKIVKSIIERKGDCVAIQRRAGAYWDINSLKKRPLLLVGLGVILILTLYLPNRILFVQVEGNREVPTNKIVEAAQCCGVEFGASRRQVRSEKVKNSMLEELPDLQWVGVNTYGCVALISVKERTQGDCTEKKSGVASLVAKTDGTISEMTVIRGNPICSVGQAVVAGQVLISGYTNCGLSIKAEVAEGEVYADTRHVISVYSPTVFKERTGQKRIERKFSLLFGKKLIKFYKDSGISDTTCVKMYKENYIKLPGGFSLPIALILEQWIYQPCGTIESNSPADFSWINKHADEYLKSGLISGEIINREVADSFQSGVYITNVNYACREMIGQLRSEEILLDGKQRIGENS